MSIRSDRRFVFEAARPDVWDAVIRTDQYCVWWPWLQAFEGAPFEVGARWHCVVKPPLPYVLRFDLVLLEVLAPDAVQVRVEGDLTGRAQLRVVDRAPGSELHLSYDLTPTSRALRMVVKVARPAVVVALDWVLDTGAAQFRDAALNE